MPASRALFRSSSRSHPGTATAVEVTPSIAGWRFVHFAVRHVVPGQPWTDTTGRHECCLVLLRGVCRVEYGGAFRRPADAAATLGPRRDVFSDYPHAIYLPPRTRFRVVADEPTELGDGRAPCRDARGRTDGPASRRLVPRVIRPEDCGFEVRGGGNATRQIIDIMPPGFPADRLLVCEVFTPAGNWSSYPPHKHDTDRPPAEVKLEEIYYYRFSHPDAYGLQRLYDAHRDRTLTVSHGDVVVIRGGYHPFVTAYGYDAYYLNVLAGTRRSMAASDDPRYAAFRSWPAPDPRVPLVPPPRGAGQKDAALAKRSRHVFFRGRGAASLVKEPGHAT
jgi:5-deoxy-glucuronate isomerase